VWELALGSWSQATMIDSMRISFTPMHKVVGSSCTSCPYFTVDGLGRVLTHSHSLCKSRHHHKIQQMWILGVSEPFWELFLIDIVSFQLGEQSE
jgi:hypothetical protein